MSSPLLTSTGGKLRVYIEIVPGAGAWDNLAQKLLSRHDATHDADMIGRILLAYTTEGDGEVFARTFPGLPLQNLLEEDAVEKIIALKPSLVIIPTLSDPTLDEVRQHRFVTALSRLLENSLNIKTTFPIVAYEGINDMLNPAIDWPQHTRVNATFMRQNVSDFVVNDIPPQQLLEKHLQGELHWPPILARQRSAILKMQNLHRLREGMFQLVSTHTTDIASRSNPALRDLPITPDVGNWVLAPLQAGLGVAGVIVATILAYLLWDNGLLALSAATLIMLGAVVMVALNTNLLSTLLASIASLLLYDYLFIPPFHSLAITGWANIATFSIYAAVCLATGLSANASHFGETTLKFQASQTRAILRLVYDITYLEDAGEMINAALLILQRTMGLRGAVILTEEEPWQSFPAHQISEMSEMEIATIRKTVAQNTILPTQRGQAYVWCPLTLGNSCIGVLGIYLTKVDQPASPSLPSIVFLRTYARLLGNAIRRVQLKRDQAQAGLQASRESLRASLLASVSHDLKTPLVSIIGSLSTLEFVKDGLPPEERQDLLSAARTEAERLHRIVHNVLEMAKLESGAIIPRKEPVDIVELASSTAARVQKARPQFKVKLRMPRQTQLTPQGDELLLSQVIYNLLDNAAKYGNPSQPVNCTLKEDMDDRAIRLEITDSGPGIVMNERERIFDKFFRSSQTDQRQAGSGLGLAICRAIARAHGGDVTVGDREDGHKGAAFTLSLPAVLASSQNSNVKTIAEAV